MEDVKALKVPELKELLKVRGLSTAGVKAELLQRLEDAMTTGDAPVPADGEAPGPSSTSPDTAAPAAAAGKAPRAKIVFPGSTPAAVSSGATSAAPAAAPAAAAAAAPAVPEPEPVPQEPEVPSKHPKIQFLSAKAAPAAATSAPLKVINKAAPAAAAPVAAAAAGGPAKLTETEKQKIRASKFNIPETEAAKTQQRAERFQITKTAVAAVATTAVEDDKKRARATKFGIVTAEDKVVAAKEKTVAANEKLAARAARFEPAKAAAAVAVKKADVFEPQAMQDELEARKKARQASGAQVTA